MVSWLTQLDDCLGGLDRPRRSRRCLIVVLLFAVVCRAIAAIAIPLDYKFAADAATYVTIARNVVDAGFFGLEPTEPYALVPPCSWLMRHNAPIGAKLNQVFKAREHRMVLRF